MLALDLEVDHGDHLTVGTGGPADVEHLPHADTGDGHLRSRAQAADIGELRAVAAGAPPHRHSQRVDHQHGAQDTEQAVGEQLDGGHQSLAAGHRIVTSLPRTSGPSIVHAAVSGFAAASTGGGTGDPGSDAAAACSSRR